MHFIPLFCWSQFIIALLVSETETLTISCYSCDYLGSGFPENSDCSNTIETCRGSSNNPPLCFTSFQRITGECKFDEGSNSDKFWYKAGCLSNAEKPDGDGSLSCREISQYHPQRQFRTCHSHELCTCYTDECNTFSIDQRHETNDNAGTLIIAVIVGIFVLFFICCSAKCCKSNGQVGTDNFQGGWVNGVGDGAQRRIIIVKERF